MLRTSLHYDAFDSLKFLFLCESHLMRSQRYNELRSQCRSYSDESLAFYCKIAVFNRIQAAMHLYSA